MMSFITTTSHYRSYPIARLFLLLAIATTMSTATQADANKSRLISADASATELILALGLGPQLVAIDVTSQLPADYPPLPSIGYHRNLSAEGLLSLTPDMVVGNNHMGPPPVIRALQQADVRWVELYSATTPKQLLENIDTLARATNKSDQGQILRAQVQAKLDHLGDNTLAGRPMVFLLQRNSQLRLAGTDTGGDALIRLLGGSNLAAFKNYRSATAESLLALQPAVILISANNSDDNNAEALVKTNPTLAMSSAGRSGQIHAVDASVLVAGLSIATVEAAQQLLNDIREAD